MPVCALLLALSATVHAQDTAAKQADPCDVQQLGTVKVTAEAGYKTRPDYDTTRANVGPLGNVAIKDAPLSITMLPGQLLLNQQVRTVNDALRNLPSVVIRDQQGLEVSRPQSRGFVSTIDQNTRMDGLNIIGTTAHAAESLAGIEVLNGIAGSLYGPETPAGVFNYVLKRPPGQSLVRLVAGYASRGIFTEQVDVGGHAPANGRLGYRLNIVHGEGADYAPGSEANRTLFSGALDYDLGDGTVVETNILHYDTRATGLPGSVVYFGTSGSTRLPGALDPVTPGLGQPGAGTDLRTNTVLARVKHDFSNGWTFQVGGLYEEAVRHLSGITNRFTNDRGDYIVIKNFNSIPRYTIASNLVQVNGHVRWLGTENDLSIGTNGFSDHRNCPRKSTSVVLGRGNLAHPPVFVTRPKPGNGGLYRCGTLAEQALVVGDTMHFTRQWAVQAVISSSFLRAKSFDKNGDTTSSDILHHAISPTFSVIYTPTAALTAYANWAHSVEPGDRAPTGTVNARETLGVYHDEQYEVGAKYAVSDRLLLTADAFRMTRPIAQTITSSNMFAVIGTQRNRGAEFFAQGDLVPHQLSILGGVTYIDARVDGSRIPGTDHKLVVGVPHLKSDISLDWHPRFLGGLAFTGSVHFESRRAATNTNNSFAPGYGTLDLGVRYVTPFFGQALVVRARVVNVSDRHYYSAIADGNIVGSPGANTAYYGKPRTFLASIEVDL